MLQSRGIHVALAAALLLAQIELPAAHGLAFARAGERAVAAHGPVLDAPSDPSHAAGHDASRCPICLALSQVRSGVDRVAPRVAAADAGALTCAPPDFTPAPPCVFERDSAPPRAPPPRALSFA